MRRDPQIERYTGNRFPRTNVEKKEKRKAVEKKIMTFEVANYPARRFLRKIGQPQTGQWWYVCEIYINIVYVCHYLSFIYGDKELGETLILST